MKTAFRFTFAALLLLAPAASADETPAQRIANHPNPAIFEAWNGAENLFENGAEAPLPDDADHILARHDFVFVTANALGVRPNPVNQALPSAFAPHSVKVGQQRRAALQALNPDLVVLASIPYRNAPGDRLPEDSPLWLRDASGQRVSASFAAGGRQFFLDYRKPETQDAIVANCKALIDTGVFDGCMFDWWIERDPTDPIDKQGDARAALIGKVRAGVGDAAILVVNAAEQRPAKSAPFINGMFMEGFGARKFSDWRVAAGNMAWGAAHLRKPALTLLEGWPTDDQGRAELSRMREVTALALTMSNGYALYADANQGKTDHAHDWYPFWSASLGRPKQPPRKPGDAGPYVREFEHGAAAFNPPGGPPAKVQFSDERVSVATGARGRSFTVAPADGDLFLLPK